MSIESLQGLYDEYLEKAITVERNRRPGEGIFGFGKKPSDDPCHARFLEDLKDWLEAFRGGEPDSGEAREVLTLIYRAAKENPEPPSAYWVLIAAQSLMQELMHLLLLNHSRQPCRYGQGCLRQSTRPV